MIAHLYMEGINLRDQGTEILCEGLAKNERIIDLDLTYNAIGKAGIKALKKALMSPYNAVIQLKLSRNPIGESVKKIAKTLLTDVCSLQKLKLDHCEIKGVK